MISMIVDTSMHYLAIGLYNQDVCLENYIVDGNRRQSEECLIQIQTILEKHQLSLKEVDEFIVTIGPGSYTGVRIALTTAKIISTTLHTPIKIISSLKALVGIKKGISIIDARSNKIFIGIYDQGKALIEEQLIAIEEYENIIKTYESFNVYGDTLLVNKSSSEINLIQNIFDLAKEVEYCKSIDTLVPTYLKEVEAKKLC